MSELFPEAVGLCYTITLFCGLIVPYKNVLQLVMYVLLIMFKKNKTPLDNSLTEVNFQT